MLEIARPPTRIAGWVHTLAGILAPAHATTAKRPDRRGYASIFDGEQAWAGGAVRCPVKLRRRFVDACYDAKADELAARQRAQHVLATWARMTGQPLPPYSAAVFKAGPGDTVKPVAGTRTAGAAKIAKAAKRRAERMAKYKRAADEALGVGA